MKNPHPVADGLIDLGMGESRVYMIFNRDGIDEEEAYALALIAQGRGMISEHHKRDVAADAYRRNGATRHVRTLFKDAGMTLVPFEEQDESGLGPLPENVRMLR